MKTVRCNKYRKLSLLICAIGIGHFISVYADEMPKKFSFLFATSQTLTEAERETAAELLVNGGGNLWANSGRDKIVQCLYETYMSSHSSLDDAGWLERLRLTQVLDYINSQLAAAKEGPEALTFEQMKSLLRDAGVVNALGCYASTNDNLPNALKIIVDLQGEMPERVVKYPMLATALALVYDQPIPREWPHHQVNLALVPRQGNDKPWRPLFEYFTSPQLEPAILKQSVDDLIYVVDAPLEITELEWARKNVRISRSDFSKAYFQVAYDNERISKTPVKYKWPHDIPYTLENIKRKGGICIDQAYFAAIAAKANGIPAIRISGGGREASHAWFGFMPKADEWNMQGGRYPGQGFVVGEGYYPQTWSIINDHQLAYISQRFTSTPDYWRSNALIALSKLHGALAFEACESILQEARQFCSKNIEVWKSIEQLYIKQKDNEKLKILYEEMAKQFKNNPDILTDTNGKIASLASSEGGAGEDEKAQKDMVRKTASGRSDLILKAGMDLAAQKFKSEDNSAVVEVVKDVLKSIGKEGGTALAYWCANVCDMLLKKNDVMSAKKVIQMAKKAIPVEGPSAINQVADALQVTELSVEIAMTHWQLNEYAKDGDWQKMGDQIKSLVGIEKARQQTEQINRKEKYFIPQTSNLYQEIVELLVKNSETAKASEVISMIKFRRDHALDDKLEKMVQQ